MRMRRIAGALEYVSMANFAAQTIRRHHQHQDGQSIVGLVGRVNGVSFEKSKIIAGKRLDRSFLLW